jgi:2-polyprenyl-6-methoxyphenol hydroxylase-like FAD-dependent oxidoreductase
MNLISLEICGLTLFWRRIGYHLLVAERSVLRRLLLDSVVDKERVQAPCRVESIHETEDHVSICTDRGITYKASVVFGADGVYSRVRDHIDAIQHADPDQCEFALGNKWTCSLTLTDGYNKT